jgi:hypothetical protein
MPVVNLAELQPGCDVERIVIEAFAKDAETVGDEFLDTLPWHELTARHRSWDWQFGHTPPFEVKVGDAIARVEHGKIINLLEIQPQLDALSLVQRALWDKLLRKN